MLLLGAATPVARHLTIHLDHWPAGAPPMRIALLSDLHVAIPGDSPTHLRHVIAAVNRTAPDLVLIAGDFLSTGTTFARPGSIAQAVDPLAALHAGDGIVAVLGNHDWGERRQLTQALPGVGVAVLDNMATRRGPLTIVGIGDITTGQENVHAALAAGRALGGFPIVLTHNPDVVPRLAPDIHLALAGHTHCGQVAPWPFGPIFTASAQGRRYACGLIREGERLTVVTAGLGTSDLPVRLGAVPDYWVIDIGR